MDNANNRKFIIEELASDESFQHYCLGTNHHDVELWEQKILENWDQWETFKQAFDLVHLLYKSGQETAKTNVPPKIVQLTAPKTNRIKWFKYAGLIASVVTLLLLTRHTIQNFTQEETIRITQQNLPGEFKEIILPDSSKVFLNANSKITHLQNWQNSKVRLVSLEGEAYFDVHSTKKPFVIESGSHTILVTGTKFNVSNINNAFAVTLEEGKVVINNNKNDHWILKPGDQLSVDTKGQAFLTKVDTEIYTAWKDRRWVFKDASIERIKKVLSFEYGINLIIENEEMNAKKINASLSNHDPDVLIEALGALYDLKITKNGKNYTIK